MWCARRRLPDPSAAVGPPAPQDHVQAAITVLGRRPVRTEPFRIDLRDTDLRGLDLQGARLERARLAGARLDEADLSHARL
ncbi:pentapeptide repeat-containing protein [Streptomyces sp. BR1]|uniref:pentapeptide repeat-containing protein n=1 Tax=Streptomyces sp. BR1 TaxID=1592323 RepID=UPI00402B0791